MKKCVLFSQSVFSLSEFMIRMKILGDSDLITDLTPINKVFVFYKNMQIDCHLYFCNFINILRIFHALTPIVLLEKIQTVSRKFSKKPSENQILFKNKKWRKNDHVRSSLAGTLSNGIKVMELLEFHEKKTGFCARSQPQWAKSIFLEKNKSCLAVGFLKNQSIWLKNTVFFSKKLEKVTVWEKVGSQEVFYFPKIKQFHPLDSTNSLQDTRYTRTSLSSTQIAGFTAFFVFRFWTHKMGSVENFAIYLSKLLL